MTEDLPIEEPGRTRAITDDTYAALRRLAANRLRTSPHHHTIQATELVHEVFLKMSDRDAREWTSTEHFLAAAARAVRWLLVDRARSRLAAKRGGSVETSPLDDVPEGTRRQDHELLSLSEALDHLERSDGRLARLVQLRYFAGASIAETAQAMSLSPATVKREWLVAKAHLLRYLEGAKRPGGGEP